MIVAKRLLILLQFAVRVAAKRTELDGRAPGLLVVEDQTPPMRVRLRPTAPGTVPPDPDPPAHLATVESASLEGAS